MTVGFESEACRAYNQYIERANTNLAFKAVTKAHEKQIKALLELVNSAILSFERKPKIAAKLFSGPLSIEVIVKERGGVSLVDNEDVTLCQRQSLPSTEAVCEELKSWKTQAFSGYYEMLSKMPVDQLALFFPKGEEVGAVVHFKPLPEGANSSMAFKAFEE